MAGLGLIGGRVVRFPNSTLKVPHIGWNQIQPRRDHPLIEGIQPGSYTYFVHSYYPIVDDQAHVVATTEYGIEFASIVAKGNVWGIQFHPEKSQDIGLAMLRNYVHDIPRN